MERDRTSGWELPALLAICAALIVLRWTKMESLYNIDPSMWLSQVGRFARGEMPYRDFSWNYPPFAIFLLGGIAKLLGPTFGVIQAAMDAISLAVVLLCWWLVRYLLPGATRFVTVFAVIAICATSLTKFNLFSFSTYSPALEIAGLGLLMLLIGGVRQLQDGASRRADFTLIAVGAFIASVTKPEALLAAWGAMILLAALDRNRRLSWYAALIAAVGTATLLVYLLVGQNVGFQQLKAGISGYGLASFACPWWPTGFGAFGAIACIGEAVFLAALLLLPVRRDGLRWLWISGIAGLAVFLAYVWYQAGGALVSDQPNSLKLEALARVVIWTSPALLPVMWASICIWIGFVLHNRTLGNTARVMCFVLSVPVIMSGRSLFGTTLFPYTEVSAMCYPFFVIAAAYLIEGLYGWALPRRPAAATIAISLMLGGYGLLRLVAAWPAQLSNRPYYTLETKAGSVRLSDDHVSEQIYSYILNRSNSTDTLLDFPYGGGFNFATRLPSPVFTTQFQQLRMPAQYQQLDLERFQKTPPRLIIADRGTHFLAEYGYVGNMNCPFPRLVWQPDEPSWDPNYVFPLVSYIEQNYRVLAQIGPKSILGSQ